MLSRPRVLTLETAKFSVSGEEVVTRDLLETLLGGLGNAKVGHPSAAIWLEDLPLSDSNEIGHFYPNLIFSRDAFKERLPIEGQEDDHQSPTW